jgi:hypothetical protein
LPKKKQRLQETDANQGTGIPGDAAIDRRFFAMLLISLSGLGTCLYGIELHDKRRGLGTALIYLGWCLVGVGLAYWWFWPGWGLL